MILIKKSKTGSPPQQKGRGFKRTLKSFFLVVLILSGLCFIVATGGGGGASSTSGTSSGTISGSAS
jgi:hypothetical protein